MAPPMFWRVRTSVARSAPWALAALSRDSRKAAASALAVAHSKTVLLQVQLLFTEQRQLWQPAKKLGLIFAGTLSGHTPRCRALGAANGRRVRAEEAQQA